MMWKKLFGHTGYDNRYAGSGVSGNFLLIGYNTNKSHQAVAPSAAADTEFVAARTDSGDTISTGCQMVFTSDKSRVEMMDLIVTQEHGIYALLNVTAGTVQYVKTGVEYVFTETSYVVVLFGVDAVTDPFVPTMNLMDIVAIPKSYSKLQGYSIARLLLYYPSGSDSSGTPELLLAGHLNSSENTGLLLFTFSAVSAAATAQSVASHSPFVTDQACTSPASCSRCLAADTSKCMECSAGYFLADRFSCTSGVCPTGYYETPAKTCARCHYSCLTCSGPLQTQCTSCSSALNRVLNIFTGECRCGTSVPYSSNGECQAACPVGYSGTLGSLKLCVPKCPAHTFHFADYASSTVQSSTGSQTASEGSDSLQFSPSSTSCLMLPGPTDAVSVPEQFTVSFWIYASSGWTSGTKALLWAFNAFSVKCDVSSGYTARLVVHQDSGDLATLATSYATLTANAWNFVTVSMRSTDSSYEAYLAVTAKGSSSAGDATRISSTTSGLQLAGYVNQILVGCEGSVSPGGVLSVTQGVDFTGYVRELVYQARYYERANLDANKYLVYSSCLEIYKSVLSYWRFDLISTVSGGYQLQDSSRFGLSTVVPSAGVPGRQSATPGLPLCSSMWETVGVCTDLFSASNYPSFAFDLQNFGVSDIETRINLNDKSTLSQLLHQGDKLVYILGECEDANTILNSATVTPQPDGSMLVESDIAIPSSAQGQDVSVCYQSHVTNTVRPLGKTYFIRIPTQISPSHGASEKGATDSLTFTLSGGDQSSSDRITLVNIDQDTAVAVEDTIKVDESLSSYEDYAAKKIAGETYAGIDTAELDRGTYTVAWRPGYMYQTAGSQLVPYKNLFVTWTLQDAPKVRFPPVSGVANSYKNTVVFKGELLYLDMVGTGQHDGDQIILCYTGCQYSNKVGPAFSRINGKYPPLWFGETAGVYNLLDNSAYDRVYLCWRSYARAARYDPDDDTWYPVSDLQKGTSAYILLNSMTDNADLPEIAATNPPLAKPVLHRGEGIWFQISKCSTEKTKPTMYSGTPGKVQLLHLIYSTYNHSSYTTEVVWEQQFASVADISASGFTVGKLSGEYDTCNYTLEDIPQSSLIPGHDYMLGIYSRSFTTPTNEFLFGNVAAGVLQFKFVFRYQEAEFAADYRRYIPSETEIVIKGTNLGDLVVDGNGFVDTRRLFGMIVTPTVVPTCSTLKTSYIALSRYTNPTQITLQGVNMTNCNGSLSLDIQLIKISDYTGEALWYYSNTTTSLAIGFIGCHYSCKTCNGTTYTDCLTCNSSTSLKYLYKGQCVSQCGDDYPYPQVIYGEGTVTLEYYTCVNKCSSGYYLDSGLVLCIQCNAQCRTCTSGDTMSCVDCKGTAVGMTNDTLDYNNTFQEAYLFKKMCMLSCPNIVNDFNPSKQLVEYDNYTHTCVIGAVPQGSHPISVTIQPIIYPQKVNIKRSIYLRALVNDPTSNMTNVWWNSHPTEDRSASGFYSSDKRTFESYGEDNINSSVTAINMNAFNYKSETEVMRLVVKVETCDSIAFDVLELYGNRPPELSDDYVTFAPTSGYQTGSYINITVTDVQDADDYYEVLKFRVLLVPRSYAIPDTYESSTSQAVLLLLSQISGANTMTIYPSTVAANIVDSTVTLTNIYIPPLMNGPQTVNNEVETSVVTADVFLYIEDRFMGVSKAKFTVNITETYAPAARESTLVDLQKLISVSTMTWELALRATHVFQVANPSPSLYYMSYSACSKDSQCGGHGECMIAGGWSECICASGYVGVTCDWTENELAAAKAVAKSVVLFLNETIVKPFKENLAADSRYTPSDTNIIDQVADALIGLLKNPETVDASYMPIVVSLYDYITRVTIVTGGRLLDFERENVLSAVDSVIKFVYHRLRQTIYEFYLLGEARKGTDDPEVEANFTARRQQLVGTVLVLRNGLYNFAASISTTQYPGDDPYTSTQDTFELFINAVQEATLFSDLGGSLGLKLGSAYVRLPINVLDSVRNTVSYNEEFKIRAIKWTENPYVFSDFHSEVSTPVYSLTLLDSNGSALSLNLTDPVVFFLPLANVTKNFPADKLTCKYFNDSMRANVTQYVARKVNVNELNMTDSQKKMLYPEWDPKLYTFSELIVEGNSYETTETVYPEFADSRGITGYGNVLKLSEYVDLVPCAAYHLSEVAAVAQRRVSTAKALASPSFYNTFDPLDTISFNIGMYVCVVVGVLFVAVTLVVWFVDIMLIPKLERIIHLHRNEYLEKDPEASLSNESPLEKTASPNFSLLQRSVRNKESEESENGHMRKVESSEEHNEGSGGSHPTHPDGEAVTKTHNGSGMSESASAIGHSSGEDSDGGSVGDKAETGSIVHVRRVKRRRVQRARHDTVDITTTANPDGGTGPTQEDLKKKVTMNSTMNQSQVKVADGNVDTSINHTTTQEMSTIAIIRTGSMKLDSTEEGDFATVKAREIRRKGKESHHVEDVFSKEYVARSEEEQFRTVNLYVSGNPVLNMCMRTNTIYTRPMRCVLLFSYIYFILFWSAVLLTTSLNELDHPEDTKTVSSVVIGNIWIMVCGPLLTNIIMFLVGGVFKLNEARIREAKTMTQYRMYMYSFRC